MEGTTLPQRYWIGEFDIDWRRSRDTMYQWWHKTGMAVALYIDFTKKWHVFVECNEPEHASRFILQRAILAGDAAHVHTASGSASGSVGM
jgi:hypothetical protein